MRCYALASALPLGCPRPRACLVVSETLPRGSVAILRAWSVGTRRAGRWAAWEPRRARVCESVGRAATTNSRYHPSTRAEPCVPVAHGWPKLASASKTLASFATRAERSARKAWHCLTGVASSLNRSLTQPAKERATGHGCQSASGEFSFCLKKGPLARGASPSAHPHRGPATASEEPRKRATKAPPRERDAGRARAERRRRRQKAVPAATARRQEAPQARRRPTEEGEAGGSYRRSSARTGPEVSREKESQSTEGTGGQKIGRGF